MSMKYISFYLLKSVQDIKNIFKELNNLIPFYRPLYGKVIMQAMIEYVTSNSVIAEQQYKHRLKYKGKHLFLLLKIACYHACILEIYDRQ